jgi:diguanylate cyclase (GGDEF)-like protein
MTLPTPKLVDILNRINQNIEEKWSALRCWEIKGCRKETCPAYNDIDFRCWLMVGTLSGGKVQGEFAIRYETCFECEVFKVISEEPVRLLYEILNTLIFHTKGKGIKLDEIAIKDQLIWLYNKTFLEEIIEREVARSDRYGEQMSFMVIGVNYSKQNNDTPGHLAGDKILIEAAKLIKQTMRRSDLLLRFGGDEFLVLLLNTNCDKSIHMVQRLLTVVDGWNRENAEAYGCHLSFSMGCSTYEKGCDILETLKEADANMYQNKIGKRNKAVEEKIYKDSL